jgi:hypothetical protein
MIRAKDWAAAIFAAAFSFDPEANPSGRTKTVQTVQIQKPARFARFKRVYLQTEEAQMVR